jgi:acetolactate synthase-1/2/3 large subunit
MHGQEFATAVHYRLAIVVVLIDNGMYGTIRMHQEREFPGRVIASNLRNPGFAAYACFRRPGRNYRRNIAVSSSFRKGPRLRIPSIIHVKIDPEAITPTTILKAIRSAALSR